MRYNPAVQRSQADADKWVGQKVRDTSERVGTVVGAAVSGGLVKLTVRMFDGWEWETDSEHATIVRDRA